MSIICSCPAASYLTTIPTVTCPENFGQIQKVAFQRLVDGSGNKNCFTGQTTDTTPVDKIKTKAQWSTFMTATDSTKIVVSPYINAPADSGGDARMSSGGNDDLGGVAQVLGGNPVNFTGQLRSVPQSVIKAMKELSCESNVGNLGVYLFDEDGRIECLKDAANASTYYPIPILSFFVGSKIHGNFDAKDYNNISWSYVDNYSNDLTIVTPAAGFNPLTDLTAS